MASEKHDYEPGDVFQINEKHDTHPTIESLCAQIDQIGAKAMSQIRELREERDELCAEIKRLDQCHREGWRYAKEIEDEYRKRTGHGFADEHATEP